MSSIFDSAQYPTPMDWDKIYEEKKVSWDKIQLTQTGGTFNFLDFQGIELSYWLKEFNNRVFDLVCSYVLMMNYYNLGIPDKEWFISPGRNGESVEYFPHFESKHHHYLYWFGFYMDSYYSRYSGILDTIYHLINIKYDFNVESILGFRREILKQLKTSDKELFKFLDSIKANTVYLRVNEFRNNITHNFRPNQIDSGINQKKQGGGITITTMSVGNYTPTNEFVANINESIDLLAFIVENVRDKIEA